MSDKQSNRISITVPESCMESIDRLVATTGLFNGRSDFVFSAIRSLYNKQDDSLRGSFYKAETMGRSALEKERILVEELTKQCDNLLDVFSTIFPGPIVRQIDIRPSEPLLKTIKEMARLFSPKDKESDRIKKMCRMAIYWYVTSINRNYEYSKEVLDKYNVIIEAADKEFADLEQNYNNSKKIQE